MVWVSPLVGVTSFALLKFITQRAKQVCLVFKNIKKKAERFDSVFWFRRPRTICLQNITSDPDFTAQWKLNRNSSGIFPNPSH